MNGLENEYIYTGNKRLRLGFTTGSCAAAAAKAATKMLLSGELVEEVALETPKGILLHLLVEDIDRKYDENGDICCVSCAVQKDAGDDPDITDGAYVYAAVRRESGGIHTRSDHNEPVMIKGGKGVGTVTRRGLSVSVGSPAINPVPRQMIKSEVTDMMENYHYSGRLEVEISIPKGEELAKRTFNPRLGIVGGLSVLGTSGIVIPMSEQALIESIRIEMKMKREEGYSYLLASPGNYGETFTRKVLDYKGAAVIKCSNFIGETLDHAASLDFKGILFVAHIGKFIKLSGGIMNTHSKNADCRAELFASAYLRAGGDGQTALRLLDSNTTEDALDIIAEHGTDSWQYQKTLQIISDRIEYYMERRLISGSVRQLLVGAVVFSENRGLLFKTRHADELLKILEI